MATPAKVKLPQALQPVEDLLLWRNVPKSAATLGGATAAYVLLEWSGIPLLTLLCNVGLALSLSFLAWALVARALNMPGPGAHLPAVLREGVDEATARAVAEKLRGHLNKALALSRRVLLGEEVSLTAKAAAALYAIGALGRVATPLGLLYTAVLAAFSLPKAYEMRKDEVDRGLSAARGQAERHLGAARLKVEEAVARFTPRKAPPPPHHHAAAPAATAGSGIASKEE